MLQITPAERAALQALADGKSMSYTAALLELDERALNELLIVLFARMGVRTKTEAVAAAAQRGLIDVGALVAIAS